MDRRDMSRVLLGVAAGSALLAKQAEAQSCTAPCYPQTPAESAAGVTPAMINTTYPPGNVLRYGASTGASGTTNATALQRAIAVIGTSGGEIIIPAGTYHVAADSVTFPHTNVTLTGAGSGMGYAAATPGTFIVFDAGTIGFDCTAITGGGGGGNYTLIRSMGVSGNSVCQYPIKIKGVVLLDDLTVTGSTAAGAGIWLFDLVNSTRLNRVSIFANLGYGLVIGGLGGGGGQNTLITLNHCTIRENQIGVRLEQAMHLTLRDTVIESNTHEGLIIYQYTGQVCANVEIDNCWIENNWAGGSSANYNIVIDSQTRDYGAGPPQYIKFTNCRFAATGSTGAINIQSVRYCRFENCGGSGAVTLTAFASYVGFYNWNGPAISGGNRCWTAVDDGNFIGGPSYSNLMAQKFLLGFSGTAILTKVKGTQAFSGTTTATVTFPTALSGAVYQVGLSQSATSPLPPWVTNKTTSGFIIHFSAAFSGSVDWIVEQ